MDEVWRRSAVHRHGAAARARFLQSPLRGGEKPMGQSFRRHGIDPLSEARHDRGARERNAGKPRGAASMSEYSETLDALRHARDAERRARAAASRAHAASDVATRATKGGAQRSSRSTRTRSGAGVLSRSFARAGAGTPTRRATKGTR